MSLTSWHVYLAMAIHEGATDQVHDERSNRKIKNCGLHTVLVSACNGVADTDKYGLTRLQEDQIYAMNDGDAKIYILVGE